MPGKNGAGKSTPMKRIHGVTHPGARRRSGPRALARSLSGDNPQNFMVGREILQVRQAASIASVLVQRSTALTPSRKRSTGTI